MRSRPAPRALEGGGRRPTSSAVRSRFTIGGKTTEKRFVLRLPAKWNGSLVIGAHGGSGGNAVDRSGKVYATSETALDDVIGQYAFAQGFAYASVDRDGVGGSDDGAAADGRRFSRKADAEILKRTNLLPDRRYLVGLSAGGGITRRIAEDTPAGAFDGALIIAGAGGDVITRLDRQQRMAALWPLIDPRAHFGLTDTDPKIVAFAEAIGTPVAARRLWPYTGASAVAAASRPPGTVENSTAQPSIPVIEVVGHVGRPRDQRGARLSRSRRAEGSPSAVSSRRRLAHVGR